MSSCNSWVNTESCGCSSKKREVPKDFEEVVTFYSSIFREGIKTELQFYASSPSLSEAVKFASLAISSSGKRCSHQRRLRQIVLEESNRKLQGSNLSSCSCFREIFSLVEDEIGGIHGVGPLMIYDTSLRIGAYLKVTPDFVYLHSGARVGAAALGLGRGAAFLAIDEFPSPFQKLLPYEIEDCLCIFKRDLKLITKANQSMDLTSTASR